MPATCYIQRPTMEGARPYYFTTVCTDWRTDRSFHV